MQTFKDGSLADFFFITIDNWHFFLDTRGQLMPTKLPSISTGSSSISLLDHDGLLTPWPSLLISFPFAILRKRDFYSQRSPNRETKIFLGESLCIWSLSLPRSLKWKERKRERRKKKDKIFLVSAAHEKNLFPTFLFLH